ncbi:hypothetical protein [Erythrobacter sp. QSSC1-22B]|uniref:hypothetical protein n=1 Tax=Erythrobacter sp. QSSC1-22B TaxID=1860125 RepID=UPI000A9845FD|nr:hypothetical protein [Erythrobacter sp. QSSC1-22B]
MDQQIAPAPNETQWISARRAVDYLSQFISFDEAEEAILQGIRTAALTIKADLYVQEAHVGATLITSVDNAEPSMLKRHIIPDMYIREQSFCKTHATMLPRVLKKDEFFSKIDGWEIATEEISWDEGRILALRPTKMKPYGEGRLKIYNNKKRPTVEVASHAQSRRFIIGLALRNTEIAQIRLNNNWSITPLLQILDGPDQMAELGKTSTRGHVAVPRPGTNRSYQSGSEATVMSEILADIENGVFVQKHGEPIRTLKKAAFGEIFENLLSERGIPELSESTVRRRVDRVFGEYDSWKKRQR